MTQPTGGGQASAAQTGRGGWLGVRVLLWARAGEGPRDRAEAHPCMRGSSSPGGQVGLCLHPKPHRTHASLPWASHEPPTGDQGAGLCLLALFRGSNRLPGPRASPGRMAKSKDRGRPGAPSEVHWSLRSQRLIPSLLCTSPSVQAPPPPHSPPEFPWTRLGVGGRAFIRLV